MCGERGIRTPTTFTSTRFQDEGRYPESFGLFLHCCCTDTRIRTQNYGVGTHRVSHYYHICICTGLENRTLSYGFGNRLAAIAYPVFGPRCQRTLYSFKELLGVRTVSSRLLQIHSLAHHLNASNTMFVNRLQELQRLSCFHVPS